MCSSSEFDNEKVELTLVFRLYLSLLPAIKEDLLEICIRKLNGAILITSARI